MDPARAVVLGIVEGLTEFLPVSSTGHLILTERALGLTGEAVKTYAIVIQAGALAAVAGLYRPRLAQCWHGLRGRSAEGRRLLMNLLISFMPAAVLGILWHRAITRILFGVWPVAAALAAGGLLMVALDGWLTQRTQGAARTLESITPREAWLIGCAQCASLWPGTSRAMATIVPAMALGLPATVAAEYSFLLALPTLGAATCFDALRDGGALGQQLGGWSVLCGFIAAGVVAWLAIRRFLGYVTRHGLALFGWYRLGLAGLVWMRWT